MELSCPMKVEFGNICDLFGSKRMPMRNIVQQYAVTHRVDGIHRQSHRTLKKSTQSQHYTSHTGGVSCLSESIHKECHNTNWRQVEYREWDAGGWDGRKSCRGNGKESWDKGVMENNEQDWRGIWRTSVTERWNEKLWDDEVVRKVLKCVQDNFPKQYVPSLTRKGGIAGSTSEEWGG